MARNKRTEIELTAYDDLFETDQSREEAALSKIRDIPISEIDEFPDHPFKVLMDEDMEQLVDSIKRSGVMILIQFAVAVGIGINLKFRTCELVVGIVLIHLCQPNVSTDAVVDEFNLHNLVHLADSHGDFFLGEYKAFWAFDFTDNPCAIRYFLKRKTTVLCGYGSRNRCFLGKFSRASLKDADFRTAQSVSVLIVIWYNKT